jgi:hypothetical protein
MKIAPKSVIWSVAHWKLSSIFRRSQKASKASVDSRHATPRLLTAEVHASAHDGGLVLLHIPSGRVYNCNRTGSRIWQGLAGGLDPDSISREISRDYGVEEAVVQAHTGLFVAELERRGFVTRMVAC